LRHYKKFATDFNQVAIDVLTKKEGTMDRAPTELNTAR
jgi:hypothetical protein